MDALFDQRVPDYIPPLHRTHDGSQRDDSTSTISDVAMKDASPEESMKNEGLQSQIDFKNQTSPSNDTNSAQTPATKTRSSRFRGVCWNKKNKRWQSAINNSGKYIYLGSFTSDVDAARAFDLAALQIRGRHTKLNFSVEDYDEAKWQHGAPPHLREKYTSGARPKPTPFAQFTGAPLRKLHPANYATVHVKRRRFDEEFGRLSHDRTPHGYLNSQCFTIPSQPKIKQECPRSIGHSPGRLESLSTPFKDVFSYLPPGAQRQVTTGPQFSGKVRDVYNIRADRCSLPSKGAEPFDDSANAMKGHVPMIRQQALFPALPAPHLVGSNNGMTPQLPVPTMQSTSEDPSLCVSSVISETVAGSEIEEAKVIIGSSRNQFGLIHRTVHHSRWNTLVYDGTNMHNMGIYSSEEDAQAACSSAVRLVETLKDAAAAQ